MLKGLERSAFRKLDSSKHTGLSQTGHWLLLTSAIVLSVSKAWAQTTDLISKPWSCLTQIVKGNLHFNQMSLSYNTNSQNLIISQIKHFLERTQILRQENQNLPVGVQNLLEQVWESLQIDSETSRQRKVRDSRRSRSIEAVAPA